MDLQFSVMMQLLAVIQLVVLGSLWVAIGVHGIVNQDLILTPKQGLQLSGKRIYFEDHTPTYTSMISNATASTAWERALKHVTYLTLFTSSTDGIITGNFSKVKAYVDFLNSPYIPSNAVHDVRFGDIVTLSRGKLIEINNGSYMFIEDFCHDNCPIENITALWQVQKIRHRDLQKNYYYEMKFSISPLQSLKTRKHQNQQDSNNSRSFIQKQEDYPNSFKGLLHSYNEKTLHRRIDGVRNFHPMQTHNLHRWDAMMPIPQPTFLRNILLPPPRPPPPPPSPPPPKQLNIGEYYKGVHLPTSISKTFPYSNLLYTFLGRDTNPFPNPITKVPSHPTGYHAQPPNRFVEYQQTYEPLITKHQQPEIITHHFHHYFYMPPETFNSFTTSTTSTTSTSSTTDKPTTTVQAHLPESDNIADGFQHDYFNVPAGNYISATTPNYNNNYELKLSTISEYQPMYPDVNQIEKQQLIRLAHIEPLKPSDIQSYQNIPTTTQYSTSQLPLFIFPAAVDEDIVEHPSDKPFIQSELLPPDTSYYSEPDPLYINVNQNENTNAAVKPNSFNDEINYNTTPLTTIEQLENTNNPQQVNTDNHLDHSVTTEYYLENQAHPFINPSESPSRNTSSSEDHITKAYSNDNTESPTQTTLTSDNTSIFRHKNKPTIHGTSRISIQSHTGASNKTQPAYSKNSRLRNSLKEMLTNETVHMTTPHYRNIQKRFKPLSVTTEKPIAKWKLRRGSSTTTTNKPSTTEISTTKRNANNAGKHEMSTTKSEAEKYEVLTQKSISKSVSIRVGHNGEEIPILVEENQNSK